MRHLARIVLCVIALLFVSRLPCLAAPPSAEPFAALSLDRSVSTLAYSPDGKLLAVGEDSQRGGNGPNTKAFCLSVAGRVLILDAKSRVLRRTLYATYSGKARSSGPAEQMDVLSLAFTPDSRTLAVGTMQELTGESKVAEITLWDPQTGKRKQSLWSGPYEVIGSHTLCFSPNGRELAAGVRKMLHPAKGDEDSDQGQILIWDVPSYRLKRHIVTENFGSEAVDYALDNHTLLCNDNSLDLWDTRTGRKIRKLTLFDQPGASYGVFSPNGRLIGGGSPWTKTAGRIWDTRTGKLLHAMPGFKEGGNCVAFTPDGFFLIGDTGWFLNPPYTHDIRIWNVQTGALVRILDGEGVYFVLSTDGAQFASTDSGPVVHFWRLH
jgi:WD40 repeat protein